MVAAQLTKDVQEGLAAGHVSVSVRSIAGGDRRLDAEVYLSPGFLCRHEIVRAFPDARPLGNFAQIWQPNRLKGIQVGEGHGAPFLAATQVFDIWPRPRKWLAQGKTPDLVNRFVGPGWILITCSGTVGDCIITYSPHGATIISHDLQRVVPRSEGMRGYLYTFLLTYYGRMMMLSSHYGNIIKHLEVAHLEALPIPVLDELVDDLNQEVAEVYQLRDEAYRLDMTARQRFTEALGVPELAEPDTGFAIRGSELFGGRRRLDAYNHNPRARAIVALLAREARSLESVRQVAATFLPTRFKRNYVEDGEPFWGSEDVFKLNSRITKYLSRSAPISLDTFRVEKHWLLMARSGQIYGLNGTVILANERHAAGLVSEHILRVVPDRQRIRPGYLQMALGHPDLGTPLVLSNAFGTSIPELAPEDIDRVPVVRLGQQEEGLIADAVEEAS